MEYEYKDILIPLDIQIKKDAEIARYREQYAQIVAKYLQQEEKYGWQANHSTDVETTWAEGRLKKTRKRYGSAFTPFWESVNIQLKRPVPQNG